MAPIEMLIRGRMYSPGSFMRVEAVGADSHRSWFE